MTLRRIGVVGGGQMGSGIAQVAAVAGFEVVVRDLDPARLGKAEDQSEYTEILPTSPP